MPLYEYECDACGQRVELIQKFSDPPADVCEACGKGPLRRLPSSPAIQFKGSGFYITDYPKKAESRTDGKTDGKSESKPDSKAETKAGGKTEGKTEGAAAPKSDAKREAPKSEAKP